MSGILITRTFICNRLPLNEPIVDCHSPVHHPHSFSLLGLINTFFGKSSPNTDSYRSVAQITTLPGYRALQQLSYLEHPSLGTMASESAARPVNGNYGPMNSYGSGDQQLSSQTTATGAPNSGSAAAETLNGPQASTSTSATSAEGASSVPKDEVGWYFVEQYYTTLSKNPEKLHVSLAPMP